MKRRTFLKGLALSGLGFLSPVSGAPVFDNFDYKPQKTIDVFIGEFMDTFSVASGIPKDILFAPFDPTQ